MIRSIAFALAAMAGLSVGAAVAESGFTIPIDKDFQDGDITWSGDAAGKAYIFVFDFRVGDGYVYLCGAGKFIDASTQLITRKIMRKSYVDYKGAQVLTDISYFTKVPYNSDLRSAKATCRATTVPAKGAKGTFTLEIAGGHFRL